jgi:hypothetical protein
MPKEHIRTHIAINNIITCVLHGYIFCFLVFLLLLFHNQMDKLSK